MSSADSKPTHQSGLVRSDPDTWIDEGKVDGKGGVPKPQRPKKPRKRAARTKVSVDAPKLNDMVGKKRAAVLTDRLGQAATAYLEDRYFDSRRIIRPIVEEVPALPEARDLYGLTLYRLGQWSAATEQLEELVNLTNNSTDHHPVLADCYRAMGNHDRVEELWLELREASPSAELVTEGRIVAAGSKADQGNYPAAIVTLSKGFKIPKAPEEFHLRRAYALADLYERSGDVLQAKSIFERIARADSDYLDVLERLDALA